MIKRVKATKIGDVFEVIISDTEKRYMQYVISDMTNLNSDVVRAFKKKYPITEKPDINEIVKDEVMFYAHCDSKHGIKMEYWTLYGNTTDVGDTDNIMFRIPAEHDVEVSYQWWIWRVNLKHQYIGKLKGEQKKIDLGSVFPVKSILYMIINDGAIYGKYPRCE